MAAYDVHATTKYFTGSISDQFILTGENAGLGLVNGFGNAVFIYGPNDTADFVGGGGNRVADHGKGTKLLLQDGTSGSLAVFGFQNDSTGSFEFLNSADPTISNSIRPDGHGGSLVGYAANHNLVDFVGDPHLSASQIHVVNTSDPAPGVGTSQSNKVSVTIGSGDTVSAGSGASVNLGNNDTIYIIQNNSNSGSVTVS